MDKWSSGRKSGGSGRNNILGVQDVFLRPSSVSSPRSERIDDDEEALKWAAVEKLPTYNRLRTSILFQSFSENYEDDDQKRIIPKEIDVRKLGTVERHNFIEKIFKVAEEDNEKFLRRLRARIDRVGIKLPTVEVRFENLNVDAEYIVSGRALPTLWNSARNFAESLLDMVGLSPTKKTVRTILKDATGILKSSRMTLLLGPPGSGKTTFLLALAGKLGKDLKVKGSITYNGYALEEFVPQKTAAYISQHDLHVGMMTVRETLDFSARCQGVELLSELTRREKEDGIFPDAEVDLFMKATAVEGIQSSLQTDYTLKILGLDICADAIVGDDMIRGISGGQKKRVTTGEMIVGPTKTFIMDEISTGLDSSTTYQIVKCLQQFASHMDATILMSLLQPAPETYDLFDDIILLSEGQIVYHGPRENVLEFFESCGFRCPERKGTADFLQEVFYVEITLHGNLQVTSKKDQAQYWTDKNILYRYISVKEFATLYKRFHVCLKLSDELSTPLKKNDSHKAALALSKYSVTKIEIFKACFAKEWLLVKRNSFVYVLKTVQIIIMGIIAMTVFLRSQMHQRNEDDGNMLPVFFKQRDLLLYPAWAYTLPTFLLMIPISLLEVVVWTVVTYYGIGFAPEAGRFLKQTLILFLVNQMSSSLFRFIAGLCRTMTVADTGGSFALITILLLGGFILPRESIPKWWIWGYWCSPLMYAENAISVNEMLSLRWNKSTQSTPNLGVRVLKSHGMYPTGYWYWLGAAALLAFILLFNVLFTIALAYLNQAPGKMQTVIYKENAQKKQSESNITEEEPQLRSPGTKRMLLQGSLSRTAGCNNSVEMQIHRMNRTSINLEANLAPDLEATIDVAPKQGTILPFTPLTMSFADVTYFVDMPAGMTKEGVTEKRLQLLQNVNGAFRPGVLTALMGVSGAGKTTLMDVLAGRKTGGYIQGDIRISGYPMRQETFARISGYCEQNDIHSPQVTAFVDEIMELVELDNLRDAIVGLPGVTGLSTGQRKRLTIAVELVANPSIIFMDEPTSGLDARAAAVVMRTIRSTVNTGRTVVCTIHQPSIDIFDAFDELLLMKRGGKVIYAGPLGRNSHKIIEYFEGL
eukprot:Gb_41755 [translate_table: standard]